MRIAIIFLLITYFISFVHAGERIISLAPSITEMVYALGAGDKLVGVTKHCDYPPEAKKKPKIGTFIHPSFEAIVNLEPDLVIALEKATPFHIISRLKKINIKVLVLKNKGLDSIWENLLLLGKILDRETIAKRLVKKLQNEIKILSKQVKGLPKPKVFWQIGIRPLITCGRASYHHELINLAGGINIVKENTAYPIYNLEEVIKAQPDIIIVSNMESKVAKTFWQKFQITNRIYIVNSDIFDRPSPRIIQALKILIQILHPEVAIDS